MTDLPHFDADIPQIRRMNEILDEISDLDEFIRRVENSTCDKPIKLSYAYWPYRSGGLLTYDKPLSVPVDRVVALAESEKLALWRELNDIKNSLKQKGLS